MGARRVYLHVGLPKTGTTYLQTVLWRGKQQAKEQGVLLPLPSHRAHFYAALAVTERAGFATENRALVPKRWERLVERVASWDQDVLISHELFASATAEQASRAVQRFTELGCEVHVVVTARDLVRQLPAVWQERLKHNRTFTFDEFMTRIQAPGNETYASVWGKQDYADVMRRWGAELPAEQRHIVTVPPSGGPPDGLWRRFAGLVGLDPAAFDLEVPRANSSLGHQQAELLRRVNQRLGNRLPSPGPYEAGVKRFLSHQVLEGRDGDRLVLGGTDVELARRWGDRMVAELGELGVTVTGDLDDLRVPAGAEDDAPAESVARGELGSGELLDESITVLAGVLERQQARQEKHRQEVKRLEQQLRDVTAELHEARAAPVRGPRIRWRRRR